jgi:hypothetical protein
MIMQTAEKPDWDQVNFGTDESHRIFKEIDCRIKKADAGLATFISAEESLKRLRESDPVG